MFQNLSNNTEEEIDNDIEIEDNEGNKFKSDIIKQTFSIQNCIIYVLSFMMSMAGGGKSIFTIAPFGFAIIAAAVGAEVPVIMVCIACLLGTIIKYGTSYLLVYILTILLFLVNMLIKRPSSEIADYETNEKKKVGAHIAIAVFVVQVVPIFFKTFYIYDFLYAIMITIATLILYKIFVNSLIVFKGLGKKRIFAVDEIIGASIIAIIAISSLGNFTIFGFSLRNILSILIVLILGWQNGMLIGAAGGTTIGLTLGIIQGEDPAFIAAYAISGFVAGLLNNFGKIGVIAGFIIGNIILSYISNGNTIEVIRFQEILIAALGLLAIPKSAGLKVTDLFDKYKLLPETTGRNLEENKETINKLNDMSDTISQIAKEYSQVGNRSIDNENTKLDEDTNKEIFEKELKINLDGKEENLLYDDIYNNEDDILTEIFEILLRNSVITRKDIVLLFAKHNNYIIGYKEKKDEDDFIVEKDIDDIVRIINTSYKVGKLNFIWEKKLEANRKNVSTQLNGVSEAISNLAEKIDIEKDLYKEQKQEIKTLLNEKSIHIKDITIKQEESKRYIITLYTDACDSIDGKKCLYKKILNVLEKVLKEKMELQKQKCGIRIGDDTCTFKFTSKDNYSMQVGIAKAKKQSSVISGDATTQTKLEDGKYLIALSDGMGSGPEARKSSKIGIKMLERLLQSGFNKDSALKLINSIISNNTDEDMYATLDVNVLDLYKGNMEFFKNGACPTFVKRNKTVEVLNSVSLPTGILENIDLVEYNYDLQDGDIIVMCSDGIIESGRELTNKELWVKYLLEDLSTDDTQRISDIILNEARDNDYGQEKDDMTVICCRISKKE